MMEELQIEVLLVIILYITLIYEIVDGIRRKSLHPVKQNSMKSLGRQKPNETQHRSRNSFCREDGDTVHQAPYRVNARRESRAQVHFVQMRLKARS